MRYFSSLTGILSFCFCVAANSQTNSHPQIRLKTGVALSFALGKDGYAYQSKSLTAAMRTIALEYNNPLNGFFASWYTGLAIDPQGIVISPNLQNFQSITNGDCLLNAHSTLHAYAGLSKRIGNKDKRNQFELRSGLGLAFAPNLGSSFLRPGAEGITVRGEQFKSPYYNQVLLSGYFSVVNTKAGAFIAPTIDLGFRWQLRNKKKNDVIGLELTGNYGLLNYFEYSVPYTIDGVDREDRFEERGINAQLNLIIPLKNFGKKKERG